MVKNHNKELLSEVNKKRLIFTFTTGRSGTGLLNNLINNHSKIKSFHEPEPKYKHVFSEVHKNPKAAKEFLLNEKLPTIAAHPGNIYIETSHLFCKGFLEELLKLGVYPELIILRRQERDVAKSMYQLNTIPGKSEKGKQFYLNPFSDLNIYKLPESMKFNDYQLCFWYTLEIRKRQEVVIRYYEIIGKKTYRLNFEHMLNIKEFRSFVKSLNLPIKRILFPISIKKVNQKQRIKKTFQFAKKDIAFFELEIMKYLELQ